MAETTHPGSAVDDEVTDLAKRHLVPAMTQIGRAIESPAVFSKASGIRVWDSEGREYVDAMSGMMNVNLGYGRDDIAQALAEASKNLSFAITFFGYSHEPQVRLAEKLSEVTPAGIERFFFTVGGSDAIDSAIKLARQYHRSRGKPDKSKIVGRFQSYHGMTLAATALTGAPDYWKAVQPLPPDILHVQQPFDVDDGVAELEKFIEREGADTVAAFIAEPISLPTGAQIPSADYWPKVREVCDRHDVLLVIDEVITGFGRTGRMFAIEHWGVSPDMLVMAKGITSGYAPLGALGMRSAIVDSIADAGDFVAHGFTAGGHPVSCAAALENLRIFEEERLLEGAEEIGEYLEAGLRTVQERTGLIRGVRRLGLLVAVDADLGEDDLSPLPGGDSPGARFNRGLREVGLIGRVYGSTVILGPSLTTTRADADEIVNRLETALRAASDGGATG